MSADVAGPQDAPVAPPFFQSRTEQLLKPWNELTRSFQPDGIVPSGEVQVRARVAAREAADTVE